MSNKQVQKTGDNSTLIQVTGDLNFGITEERAREICHEMLAKEMANLVSDANNKAKERALALENKLIDKIEECNDLLKWFNKPEFLYLIRSAQKSAIQTDRDHDYDLLVNLLLNKTKRENDRKFGTGVKQAIEIVNDIDDDSLKAMTVIFVHMTYWAAKYNVFEILSIMDDLYQKIGIDNLPNDKSWMDQLDVLKCIRISEVTSLVKLEDYYMKMYPCSFANGIKIDSSQYLEACNILKNNGIPNSILAEHELNPGYVKLIISKEDDIDNLRIFQNSVETSLSEEQKIGLFKVLSLYVINDKMQETIKENLIKEIEKKQSLNIVREWINNLGHFGNLTCVGKVIAYTEAKMKYHDLPSLFAND